MQESTPLLAIVLLLSSVYASDPASATSESFSLSEDGSSSESAGESFLHTTSRDGISSSFSSSDVLSASGSFSESRSSVFASDSASSTSESFSLSEYSSSESAGESFLQIFSRDDVSSSFSASDVLSASGSFSESGSGSFSGSGDFFDTTTFVETTPEIITTTPAPVECSGVIASVDVFGYESFEQFEQEQELFAGTLVSLLDLGLEEFNIVIAPECVTHTTRRRSLLQSTDTASVSSTPLANATGTTSTPGPGTTSTTAFGSPGLTTTAAGPGTTVVDPATTGAFIPETSPAPPLVVDFQVEASNETAYSVLDGMSSVEFLQALQTAWSNTTGRNLTIVWDETPVSLEPLVCPRGMYPLDNETCAHCPADTYNPAPGADTNESCLACPANTTSDPGSVEPTACLCQIHYEGPDGGPCSPCSPGFTKLTVGDAPCEGPVGVGRPGFADGNQSTALFNLPTGVAVLEDDRVVITEVGNHAVRMLDPVTMSVVTIAGAGYAGFRDGVGTSALLNNPTAVAVLTGTYLVVADGYNHRLRGVDVATRAVDTLAGTGRAGFVDGDAWDAELYFPSAVAVDASQRSVFFADMYNRAVRVLDMDAGTVSTLHGAAGNGAQYPMGVALRGGDVLVSDQLRSQIAWVPASPSDSLVVLAGTSSAECGDGPLLSARFAFPRGMVAANASGLVYVADTDNARIRVVDPDGDSVRSLIVPGLSQPTSLALHADEQTLVVADAGNHQVRAVRIDQFASTC